MNIEQRTIESNKYCNNFFGYSRFMTRIVNIGGIPLGGNNPIRVQSMTNTDTMNTNATIEQTIRLIHAGCEYVRITTPSMKEAENLLNIQKELHQQEYKIPLIADVHFNPAVAEFLARHIAKVRINPGNYADKKCLKQKGYSDALYNSEIDNIRKRFTPLVKICKEYGTAIRIGVNHGSLSYRIMNRYGDTSQGMVESAMEFIRICVEEKFNDIVLSMKSSNPIVMIHACRLLVVEMKKNNFNYPLHLGVTEAGMDKDGIIKSAVGIGTLLEDGIGDTIRVSLTDDPIKEIPIAKIIVSRYAQRKEENRIEQKKFFNPYNYKRRKTYSVENIGNSYVPVVIGEKEKNNLRLQPDFFSVNNTLVPLENIRFIEVQTKDITIPFINKLSNNPTSVLIIEHSKDLTVYEWRKVFALLSEHNCKTPVIFKKKYSELSVDELCIHSAIDVGTLLIDGFGDGIMIIDNKNYTIVTNISFRILQASRTRISQTEYISCPTCGRTLFNVKQTLACIKEKTNHLKGLKIAVMGCIVNGPGEMADADYGCVGTANGNINLYKGKQLMKKNIAIENAVESLILLIINNGDWIEPLVY